MSYDNSSERVGRHLNVTSPAVAFTGISALFLWRMVMKRFLHFILPIIFRSTSQIFHFALPTRRHYQAATDYDKVPTPYTLNPLPSFVDLPSQASLTTALPPSLQLHKRSRQASHESFSSVASSASQQSIESARPPRKRAETEKKHYDVDGEQPYCW